MSVPSFLHAATRPFIPPKAATEVAVAAFVVLPELDVDVELPLPELPLLHPAASMRPLTARAAAAIVLLLLGTDPPQKCAAQRPACARPGGADGGIVPAGING